MQKSKKYFYIAATALLLSTPLAYAAPTVEITAAISQPTLAIGASLDNSFGDAAAVVGQASTQPVPSTTKAQAADKPAAELSDWSMLLVGAGVLLLPRKRRVDNAVR